MAGERQTEEYQAVPMHPLTDLPAKFEDIPERVHRDAYWLALQKRAEAEARAENQAAEIVALLRSYANVHMTRALADLIEHRYVGRPPQP